MPGENVQKLAALFSGINTKISMDKFEDKLAVQKITYLAQQSGIDLGYQFEWYLRGPYCKLVSNDAHEILHSRIESTPVEAGLEEEKIQAFGDVLRPYLNDSEWLEIAGSLVYLRNEHFAGKDYRDIIGYLIRDLSYGYKNFSESLIRRVLAEILRIGLIN